MKINSSEEFISICREWIANYYNDHCEKTDDVSITAENVYVVWYSKTLQNHKGLFSTTQPDGMYYEATYNGDKGEIYFDAYKKWQNVVYEGKPEMEWVQGKGWVKRE